MAMENLEVKEADLDAVTAVSGSGPAYVFLFIEALADGGVRAGLSRQVALQLAAQTVKGAAQMQLETGLHPGVLKDQVCSPGGTTIAAVEALEKNGFRYAAMSAVAAANAKCHAAMVDEVGRTRERAFRLAGLLAHSPEGLSELHSNGGGGDQVSRSRAMAVGNDGGSVASSAMAGVDDDGDLARRNLFSPGALRHAAAVGLGIVQQHGRARPGLRGTNPD